AAIFRRKRTGGRRRSTPAASARGEHHGRSRKTNRFQLDAGARRRPLSTGDRRSIGADNTVGLTPASDAKLPPAFLAAQNGSLSSFAMACLVARSKRSENGGDSLATSVLNDTPPTHLSTKGKEPGMKFSPPSASAWPGFCSAQVKEKT